ncbi:membrane protein [Clostridia bacterium]|nr:membrane protein [Clostridia bacterium]
MKKAFSARKVTHTAIMIALGVVLAFTSIRIPPNPEITIALLPVIILAILDGPLCGLIAGVSLGVVSIIINVTMPASPLSPYFANPLVSVLPRALVGVGAYAAYALTKKLPIGKAKDAAAAIVGGAFGSIVNTVFVLGIMGIIYYPKISDQLVEYGLDQTVPAFLIGIATVNGVLELIANAVLTTAVVLSLQAEARFRRSELN